MVFVVAEINPKMARATSTTVRKRTHEVYTAVTRGDLGQAIRKLPVSVQRRFKARLEAISLPEKEKHRLRFLGELADLAARLFEPGRADAERATGLMRRRGYREGMVRDELGAIEKTFELIRDVALVSMRSSKPSDYVRLISRPGVDIERFVSTMWFFAGDRRIRMKSLDMEQRKVALDMERLARESTADSLRALLSIIFERLPRVFPGASQFASDWGVLQAFDIAAPMVRNTRVLTQVLRADHEQLIRDKSFFLLSEMLERIGRARETDLVQKHAHDFLIGCGIYLTDGGKMLRFGKMFKEGPIEGYVVLKPERLRSYGYEAMTTADIDDPTALLASEKEHTLQHELQHLFDKIIYVESALRTMADGTGETRRNLLSMEYRARLAEMAFTHDLELVEDAMREVHDNLGMEEPGGGDEMLIRTEADAMVHERMGRFMRGPALKRVARSLLDQAYRQAYGLTYSQIVEPFAHALP
jgi:hypothetical protein